MKTPNAHFENMHARLDDVSSKEQLLIAALGEALSRADKKLLDDVRSLTIEHENRRALILTELQSLAARIGAFPASSEDEPKQIEQGHLDLPFYELGEVAPPPGDCAADAAPMDPTDIAHDDDRPRGADWRQAARNIRDELGYHINGHLNGHLNGKKATV